MKTERKIQIVLCAILGVIDRTTSTMAAACLVAALLGTIIQPEKVSTAYIGSVIFFVVALLTSAIRALIEEDDS